MVGLVIVGRRPKAKKQIQAVGRNVQNYNFVFVCSIDCFILHQENLKKRLPQNNFRRRRGSWKFQKIKMYAKIEENNVTRSVKLT